MAVAAASSIRSQLLQLKEALDADLEHHDAAASPSQDAPLGSHDLSGVLGPNDGEQTLARWSELLSGAIDALCSALTVASEQELRQIVQTFETVAHETFHQVAAQRRSLAAALLSIASNELATLSESFDNLVADWLEEQVAKTVQVVTRHEQALTTAANEATTRSAPQSRYSSPSAHNIRRRLHDGAAIAILDYAFERSSLLTAAERVQLAELTGLSARQVMTFWQNKRFRNPQNANSEQNAQSTSEDGVENGDSESDEDESMEPAEQRQEQGSPRSSRSASPAATTNSEQPAAADPTDRTDTSHQWISLPVPASWQSVNAGHAAIPSHYDFTFSLEELGLRGGVQEDYQARPSTR